MLLFQNLHARPVAAFVAGIGAVNHGLISVGNSCCANRPHDSFFAEIATISRIGRHLVILENVCIDHAKLSPQLAGKPDCILILKFRLKLRLDKIGSYIRSGASGRIQQKSRVRSAGKSQRRFRMFSEEFIQLHARSLSPCG